MVVNALTYVLHGTFAALWTGSVLFVAVAVIPPARNGAFDPAALRTLLGRLQWITRVSVIVTLVTGGHLAGTYYTVESLTGTGAGHLVLTMLVLWALLAVAVEIGAARANRSIDQGKKREPARIAMPYFVSGAVFAAGLLLVAGLLGSNRLVGLF